MTNDTNTDKAGNREGLAKLRVHDARENSIAALSTGNEEPGREGAIPASWKLVPEKPSEEMLAAAWKVDAYSHAKTLAIFDAMIAAAPTPPVSPEPDSRAWVERDTGETEENDRFARELAEAYETGMSEYYARVLSGRLRQMDKRARAANVRADRAEAENVALRAVTKRMKAVLRDCRDTIANPNPGICCTIWFDDRTTLQDHIDLVLAAIQSAPTASAAAGPVGEDWQPIDTAPLNKGERVLLGHPQWLHAVIGYWWSTCWREHGSRATILLPPTHWMPLKPRPATPTPAPLPVPAKEGRTPAELRADADRDFDEDLMPGGFN